MKRRIPLTITLVLGIVMMVQFFIPHKASQDFFEFSRSWIQIMVPFALVLGVGSFISHHLRKIRHRKEGWFYSPIALTALFVMLACGLLGTILNVSWLPVVVYGQKISLFEYLFRNFFNYMLVPLGATMFSILAFYIASAAYRAFHAKSFTSILLLAAAFVIMLAIIFYNVIPLGNVGEWLLSVPNLAAKRGILLGVALGMVATALKIILGIERGYLGGTK
ncbi:hypothetical protein GF359_03995 [candidate division WOR-3 bacterium]|uniref:Uncharacterized protein n=1 Tax=candidate division WOR-3 bacterium TaxID=2052148 RepID=A0A9D5K918_UNCW3|nr:hypothetical protein [candidate division WOR-3 bacterium]MBD3364359.1 hypothetical protein [candidate division WOR-3 bacterium]